MLTRSSRRDLVSALAQLRGQLRHCMREIEDLRIENEILRDAAAPLIHLAPAGERFAFVHARRGRFGVKRLCRVLVTDGGNYRAWARSQANRRERAYDDQRLTALIFEVHTAYPAYGALRVARELQRQGVAVGRRVVARLMRQSGIAGVTRRRRRGLTRPDANAVKVPDLIRRDFTAPMPGLKLVGDITCFATGEGWLYLATAIDLCSREVVGYALGPHMRTGLAVDAITAAHRTGLVGGNAIMHTYRGSQYHAKAYRNALRLRVPKTCPRRWHGLLGCRDAIGIEHVRKSQEIQPSVFNSVIDQTTHLWAHIPLSCADELSARTACLTRSALEIEEGASVLLEGLGAGQRHRQYSRLFEIGNADQFLCANPPQ